MVFRNFVSHKNEKNKPVYLGRSILEINEFWYDYIKTKVLTQCKTNCVKSVSIQSYSGPYFPTFRMNTERYSISVHIQSECRKTWTRITLNMDTFYEVTMLYGFR